MEKKKNYNRLNNITKEEIETIILNKELFSFLKDKTILIHGGTSYIGSFLSFVLIAANTKYDLNINIYCSSRNRKKIESLFFDYLNNINIIDTNDIFKIKNIDYIVHAISPTNSKYITNHPVETLDTMLMSLKNVLEYAQKNTNTKILYLSSMEQYGSFFNEETIDEKSSGYIDHLLPRSSYPIGKKLCEAYCSYYSKEFGVKTVIARLSQTFGPGVSIDDNRLFMYLAKSIIEQKNIILESTGETTINYCYICDTISALLILLKKGISGEAYNVCNYNETRSVIEIAQLVSQLSEKEIKIKKSKKSSEYFASTTKFILNSEKLTNLGWKPNTKMLDAYIKLISYVKNIYN